MLLSFCMMSSAVLISTKLRGDPVSASQLSLFLFFSVVCMMISSLGVDLYISEFQLFPNFLFLIMIILFQSSISSVMYIVVSESIVSVSSSSSSGGSISWLSDSFMFFYVFGLCCLSSCELPYVPWELLDL